MTAPQQTQLVRRVKRLLALYEQGAIPTLAQHEVHPGLPRSSRENYLYFTLPISINFQRSSVGLWAAALKTWQDETTRYVFFPEQVVETGPDTLREDLRKHSLALLPNRHPYIWSSIAGSLHAFYHNDPRRILAATGYDAAALIRHVRVDHPERFPYLRGPKLANYWPFILSHYTDVRFSNAHAISIIPDTHVIKASVHLGLVAPGASAAAVELAWTRLLHGSGIEPSRVHPVLWNWSRNGFTPSPDVYLNHQ